MLALSELQTLARYVGVPQKREHSNRVEHHGWDLQPQVLLGHFVTAEQGDPRPLCDAIDDIAERDLTFASLWEARTDALAGKYLVVQPGDDSDESKANAKAFAEIWARLDTSALVRHQQGNTVGYGWAASEIEWSYSPEGRVDPVAFYHARNRDFYVATTYFRRVLGAVPDELLLRRSDMDPTGERLVPGKWLVCRRTHRLPVARAGLGRGSAMMAVLKSMTVAEWVVYIRRFGIPFILLKIDDYTSQAERAMAEQILRSIGSDGGAISAKVGGPEISTIDGAQMSRQSTSDLQQRLVAWADTQLAKLWNGAVLSTESGEGAHSYAQAKVQDGIRVSLLESDAVRFERTVNDGLCTPWWQVNSLPGLPPRVKFHLTEISDPLTFVTVAEKLHAMGVPLSMSHVLTQTGMRMGTGNDLIPRAPAPSAVEPPEANEA